MTTNSTAALKVTSARTTLVLDQPFWGVLALRLTPVETRTVPMGATDGTSLFFNPDYVERIPFDELVGLIAEEVGHCAMGHMWRRDGRDAQRWNLACDYALAGVLRDAGFNTGDMLHDPQYAGRSAEWIYARLPQTPPQSAPQPPQTPQSGQPQSQPAGGQTPPQTPPAGQPSSGQPQPGQGRADVLDAPGDASDDASQDAWQQAVEQAAIAAQGQGTLSADAARLAESVKRPRVDWRSLLQRFVQQIASDDYSWTRPSARYRARGLYLPALRSEQLGAMVVAIDTSGSIDHVMLEQFQSEVRTIVDECQPTRVHVIYCDACVHGVDTFERGDVVTFHAKGGGGTAFGPAFDAAEALDDAIACFVYLTDLMGTHRATAPDFPVLWVSTRDGRAPFGDVIVVS